MRKTTIVFIACMALFILGGCATTADRTEARKQMAQQVEQALADRHFSISVDMMYPRRGRTVNLTTDYSLEVRGDTLISYLPYFGRAYNLPYGGGKGLNFTAPIKGYQAVKAKKDMTRVIIETQNDEDQYIYQIEVFDNGSASVYVNSRERESINYTGRMRFNK